MLFPEGMDFLRAEYGTQSTKMASIIEQIDKDNLASDIDAIAGKMFLKEIRDVQPRYAAMVSERLRRDEATGQNLADTVREIQGAIVNYASKMIGTIEHDDPATAEVARLALLPIANFRGAAAARASAKGKGAAEAAPGGEGRGAQPGVSRAGRAPLAPRAPRGRPDG